MANPREPWNIRLAKKPVSVIRPYADDLDDALTNWLEWTYGFAGIGSHRRAGTLKTRPARLVIRMGQDKASAGCVQIPVETD